MISHETCSVYYVHDDISKLDVHGSVHRNINLTEITNKMRPVAEFINPTFLNCSTCFERHTAHHQELKNCNCNLWFYIRLWWPAAAGHHKRM